MSVADTPDDANPSAVPRRILYRVDPAVVYLHGPPVVVDCSVMAALVFDEPAAAEAERWLLGKALYAPTLLPYEIANVARNKQRAGLAAAQVNAAIGEFIEHPVEYVAPPTDAVLALALRYTLSAYDAAYLWLAGHLPAPLASFDKRLVDAARQHLSGASS